MHKDGRNMTKTSEQAVEDNGMLFHHIFSVYCESKTPPAFERPVLPEYINLVPRASFLRQY